MQHFRQASFEFFGDLQDLVLHLDYVVRDVLQNPEVLDWALDVEDHGDHTH